VTQNLVDHQKDLETGAARVTDRVLETSYTHLQTEHRGVVGAFTFANFQNPVMFICSMIGAVENTTAPETASCAPTTSARIAGLG